MTNFSRAIRINFLGSNKFKKCPRRYTKEISFKIHSYYKHVDDTFLKIPKNMIQEIIDKFNACHSRSKFTYELETDNALPYLNLLTIKNQGGTIKTN